MITVVPEYHYEDSDGDWFRLWVSEGGNGYITMEGASVQISKEQFAQMIVWFHRAAPVMRQIQENRRGGSGITW